MAEPRVEWTDERIEARLGGEVVFIDTLDHFQTGRVRRRGISPDVAEACRVAAAAGRDAAGPDRDSQYEALAAAWEGVVPAPDVYEVDSAVPAGLDFGTRRLFPERVWAPAIRGEPGYCMVGSEEPAHAWLVHRRTGTIVVPDDDYYEEDYFEGDRAGVGYGDYLEQAGWRLEKAARQARQVQGILRFLDVSRSDGPLRLLDVGAGYGFFRHAAGEAGFEHEGTEISRHAANVATELFGFDTRLESLADVASSSPGRFDAIVMWDFLEHVEDPVAAVADARAALAPGGVLFVRTPNLLADEHRVFGTAYHSLKLEHLHMFSPGSLSLCLAEGGLVPRVVLSESHLLQGFVGLDVDHAAATLHGSDLLGAAQRPG